MLLSLRKATQIPLINRKNMTVPLVPDTFNYSLDDCKIVILCDGVKMALFLPDKTECKICQKVIMSSDDYTAFGIFIDNENDPLFFFNDSVFHAFCVKEHPLGEKALDFSRAFADHVSKRKMKCCVCGSVLSNPDDFFVFGNLYDAEKDLRLSYKQCHETCLPKLGELDVVYDRLLQLNTSGEWDGCGPRSILKKLKEALGKK